MEWNEVSVIPCPEEEFYLIKIIFHPDPEEDQADAGLVTWGIGLFDERGWRISRAGCCDLVICSTKIDACDDERYQFEITHWARVEL